MEDVGLQNELGQRQVELLHDRRSAIKVKMFAPANVNVGRSGTKTTNIRSGEEGIDMVSRDDWAKLGSLTDLEMALDNIRSFLAWGPQHGDVEASCHQGEILQGYLKPRDEDEAP